MKFRVDAIERGEELPGRNGAEPVFGVGGVAGDGDADARAPALAKALAPEAGAIGRDGHVGNRGGDAGKLRAEDVRQAKERAMVGERHRGFGFAADGGIGEGSEQRQQRRLRLQQHADAARAHQRHVADELQRVAQALLGVQQ